MNFADALPTFVVTLREGVEAALVVGIVLAYLKKANQPQLNRWVFSGIGVGIIASVLIGILFSGLLVWLDAADGGYAPVVKQVLEGAFGVVAIALLSWMLVWMTQQAKGLKAEVEGSITAALQQANAGWGVFGLIAIAVLREGFETVLFIAAQFQQGWMPVVGAIAGLTGATLIGFLLFQLGIKINLRQFFLGMGVLLLLIVAGLVVSALHHFDAAIVLLTQLDPRFAALCFSTDSCILGTQVWNFSRTLPDGQFPGILLKALLGYREQLYWVQAIAYLLFLSAIGTRYFQSLNPPRTEPAIN